ncbi:MAG: hypothetical protein DMD92_00235 [Candidatus Rokuibacteriota bacterium]|nr:MAG: hypothetical protein DMD92_00235 [Candidatus Rokubacteria bacterium]
MTRRFIGLLLALTLVATDAAAQTYRWVDEQGQVHYAGSREQVPEQYRPQLPPAEPAAPGASTPAAPGASTPEASGRPPTLLAGECMLLIPGGTRRPHDSRSYPNCDECRKAVEGLGADQAARASCIPLGQ